MGENSTTGPPGRAASVSRVLISRAAGLTLGILADAALGDPQTHHPVAWFGTWATAVEQRLYADDTAAGAVHLAACVAPVVALGAAAERASRRHPLAHTLATAVATWAVVGACSLSREGSTMAARLDDADLDGARNQLCHLCSREPDGMTAADLARATVESMAENTNDAVVAPLLWGATLGIPGLLAHRAVNTLDAMVGHLNPRYRHFGTASALTDDAMAWLSARATGLLACATAPAVGGDATRAWRTMLRDHADHPSPNGGWCESAWAGALGVQLGGVNVYHGRTETRGLLGDGPRPDAGGVAAAARLVTVVTAAATAATAAALVVAHLIGRKS